MSVFPDDVVYAPQSWTEQAYPNLVHYNEVDQQWHFAAWEQPELYASELRAASGRSARPTEFTPVYILSLGGANRVARHQPLGPAELRAALCCPSRSPPVTSASSSTTSTKTGRHRNGPRRRPARGQGRTPHRPRRLSELRPSSQDCQGDLHPLA